MRKRCSGIHRLVRFAFTFVIVGLAVLVASAAEGVFGNPLLGSTGDSPVPPGDSPGGIAGAFRARIGADFAARALAVPFGGSPTGTGESPVLPILRTRSGNAQGAGRIFQWRPFLAPFHSVVLHYPIGFLTMAFLLELYRWRRPSPELRRITKLVILLGLVSGVIAATLGIMRAGNGGYEAKTLALHRTFGLTIPFLTLLTLWLHLRLDRADNRPLLLVSYRGLLACTLVVLVMAGHLGGNLTHGSKYLVQNAPEFVKALLDEEDLVKTSQEIALDEAEKLFVETIQPIFEAKCISCHGQKKQKGAYRLDQQAIAFKGGESELEAIKPNDPMRSELVRRILLPSDHDDAMPPDGKQCLSPEEILQIVHWIQNGAPFVESRGSPKVAAAGRNSGRRVAHQ